MISGEIEVNWFALVRLMLEAEFGDGSLLILGQCFHDVETR